MTEYRGWQYSARIIESDGVITEFYISFYKQLENIDWYDEVRYDSHERKRGKRIELPHFHIKLHGSHKSFGETNRDLRDIIDSLIPKILEVTEK